MRILAVNLKLLYQKRPMLVWYFFIGIFIFMFLSRSIRETKPENIFYTGFTSPILAIATIGCTFGRLFSDIWNKPNFFCLPGEFKSSQRILLLLGLAVAIITSLSIAIFFPWMINGAKIALIMLAAYYLMIYWLHVIISIYFEKITIVLLCIVFFFFPIMGRIGLWYTYNNFLLNHIWASTFTFCFISVLIYSAVGNRHLFRSLIDSPGMTYISKSNYSELNRSGSGALVSISYIKRLAYFNDYFFSDHILLISHTSVLHYPFARIYVIFKSLFFYWRTILLLSTLFFSISYLMINSYPAINLQPFFFSLLGIVFGYVCVITRSDIFIPISRKWRFFGEISTVITAVFIALIFALVFIMLSNFLHTNIITFIFGFGTDNPVYISLNIRYILFSLMLLPATSALVIIFRKNLFLSVILMAGIAISILCAFLYTTDNSTYILNTNYSYIMILAIVISFGFFLAIAYYDNMKRTFF